MRQVRSSSTPRSGAMVTSPPSRWSSAETPTPGGWLPCSGCASCRGSPTRTRLRAARDTASASASDIWPASSTISVSKGASSSRAREQPRRSADHVDGVVGDAPPRPPRCSGRSGSTRCRCRPPLRCCMRTVMPSDGASSSILSSSVRIALWVTAVTPIGPRPCSMSASAASAAMCVFPAPGGPCTGRHPPCRPRIRRIAASDAVSPRPRSSQSACRRAGVAAGASAGRARRDWGRAHPGRWRRPSARGRAAPPPAHRS